MSKKSLEPERILALLATHPECLTAVAAGARPEQLHAAPDSGEWSAVEILAHLRSCADVWGDAIATILAEDNPTIRAIDPRTWTTRTDYPTLDFHTSLRAFTKQRAALLAVLEPLPPDAWSRAATVTGAGRPLTRTLHSFANRLAIHERPHLKQIERVVQSISV